VKTWVKTDVKNENVTFFTARIPTESSANSPRTAFEGPMSDHSLTSNGNYLMDDTFQCRIIHGKKVRPSSAGLKQLATWNGKNFAEATATGGSG